MKKPTAKELADLEPDLVLEPILDAKALRSWLERFDAEHDYVGDSESVELSDLAREAAPMLRQVLAAISEPPRPSSPLRAGRGEAIRRSPGRGRGDAKS